MSYPSENPRLPVEILGHILSDVDFKTLKACSLTSRVFYLVARSFIFERATITFGGSSHRPSTKFLDFLTQAEESNIASTIATLCLAEAPSSSPLPANLLDLHWLGIAEQLTKLLPKLTRLHHLIIRSSFFSDWTSLCSGLRPVLLQFIRVHALQHVELHYVGLSRGELLDLAWIREVTLVGVYEASKQVCTRTNPLSQHEEASLLRNLSITLKNPVGAQFIFELADATRNNLISLRWLTSPYLASQDPYFERLDLPALSSLTHLEISLPFTKSFLAKLSRLLDSYPAEHLQVLEIVIDCEALPGEETVLTWDWQRFIAVLTRMTAASLTRVKVWCKQQIVPKCRKRPDNSLSSKALSIFRAHLLLVMGLQVEG